MTTNNYVWEKDLSLNDLVFKQKEEIERLHSIIKEAREYIRSYESISIMQSLEDTDKNKILDDKTMLVMINRYLKVHDKLLEILDKENI